MKNTIGKNYLKSKKGITIITLIITIVIILILTTVTVTNTYTGSDLRRYKLMCADVELLEDKILYFYRQYEELPIGNKVTTVPQEINNGHTFYKININKLNNITLNYGDEEDVFIVDSTTFEVYYLNGIEYDNQIYYTD